MSFVSRCAPGARAVCVFCAVLCLAPAAFGRDKAATKASIDSIHQLAKTDSQAIPRLAEYLNDPAAPVRLEAVKAIVRIGTEHSLEPLAKAAGDPDADVETLATGGIVNFYLPGYVPRGVITGPLDRSVKGVKTILSVRNRQELTPDIAVRPSVAEAITNQIRRAPFADTRANAARAAGILHIQQAIPALEDGLRSRDTGLILECLYAIQKIHDPSAGSGVVFLCRDLENPVQIAALETVGALKTSEAAPDVRYVIANPRNEKIRRAALAALAQIGLPADRPVFQQYAASSDADLRAAALEGLGRVREPEDFQTAHTAFEEPNVNWRIHLAAAFAMVNEGKSDTAEFSPLRFLVENLDQSGRSDVAEAYVSELSRREEVRKGLYALIADATPDQKQGICQALGASNASDAVPVLTSLRSDPNPAVSLAAARALRTVQARKL